MPSSSNQSVHGVTQFLNSHLSMRGTTGLPYQEDMKWAIRQQLLALIQDFPSMKVKVETFTHNDGRTANLLQADGTIPMKYQNVKYNIPSTMWLVESFPQAGPLLYVTPTRDMIIKPRHPHVDPSGMVIVPYLEHWFYPRSNLKSLAQSVSALFGQDPPLYSRPPSQRTSAAPVPSPRDPHYQSVNPIHSNEGGTSTESVQGLGTSSRSSTRGELQLNPYTHPPYTHSGRSPQHDRKPSDPSEVFRANAIRAVSERIERDSELALSQLRAEIERLVQREALLSQRRDLLERGFHGLLREREMLECQLQIDVSNTNVVEDWLRKPDTEELGVFQFHEACNHIDDAFEAYDEFSRQMLDSSAADLAIEDTLYSLDRIVQDGAVSLEVYLKSVRTLSREQFFYRAMCVKSQMAQSEAHVADLVGRESGL